MAEPNLPPDFEPPEEFDSDGPGIVELFDTLRGKLIVFFSVRGCFDPEEHADTTLARVFQKLCNGTKVGNLAAYTFGVAKKVLLEHYRKKTEMTRFVDEQKYKLRVEPSDEDDDSVIREHRLKCLDKCLARLKEQDRKMLLDYFKFKGREKMEHRRKMAEQMGISRDALSLRIFHLKQKLGKCVSDLLENM